LGGPDAGKLREAALSLRKQDDEARDILLASIKLGVLLRHKETYLPSLNTLLQFPSYPPCIVGWYALYVLFLLQDFGEFYFFTTTHRVDEYYSKLAKSLVRGDYIVYAQLLEKASPFDKAIIIDSPGDVTLRKHTLNVISKAYRKIPCSWLHTLRCTAPSTWSQVNNVYILRPSLLP
jgi:hypothetical protein